MKAARFHGRGDIRVEEVPEPEVRPGTVLVEVEWCGICGTDLHEYLDGPIVAPPAGRAATTSAAPSASWGSPAAGGGFSRYVLAERRGVHPLRDLGTDVGALLEALTGADHAVR